MYSMVPHVADPFLYDQETRDQSIYPAQNSPRYKHPSRHAESYLAFFYDKESGKIRTKHSSDLAQFSHSLLVEVEEEILKQVLQKIKPPPQEPDESSSALQREPGVGHHHQNNDCEDIMPLDDTAKRSRSETIPLESMRKDKPRTHKARKPKSKRIIRAEVCIIPHPSSTSITDPNDLPCEATVTFALSDTIGWEKWLADACRFLQQLACRTMAKEWIKLIHPKKQSTNPYNGKKLKAGQAESCPESTKPAYWPREVIHKEPDHINKEDRTKLLVHLVMATPHKELCPPGRPSYERWIYATDLEAALEGKFEDKKYGLVGKKFVVHLMLDTRTQLERFNDGGYPKDASLTMPDFSHFRKPHSTDEDALIDTTDDTLELAPKIEDYDDDDTMVITPRSEPDSPAVTDIAVVSEPLRKRSKKVGVRNKTNKRSKQREDSDQNVSFNGSTSTMGSRHMLATSFDSMDQLAHHPQSGDQMALCLPHMWGPIPPQSNPLVQYPYAYFGPPDPRSAHSQNQFPVEELMPMPVPQPQFSNMAPYFDPPPCSTLPFHNDLQPEQDFSQAAYAYFPPGSCPP